MILLNVLTLESANIINGMEAFKSSTLAQSLFLRYKKQIKIKIKQ